MNTDALVVAHGKSEILLAEWLAGRTWRRIDICSRSGGEQTIAMKELGG
ncbi:MAG: hypothetical protein Q4Q58_00040 [Thermoplasmata archaeon]|nr:hypothetical protein [Thermoplasmata archaeon]